MNEPPNDQAAEEHLLSCCFADDNATLSRALQRGIVPESFYCVAHRIVFQTMTQLLGKGQAVTAEAVGLALDAAGQLKTIGGFPVLMRVSATIATTAAAGQVIERVASLHAARETIRSAEAIASVAGSIGDEDLAESVSPHVTRLLAALGGHSSADARSWDAVLDEALTTAENVIEGKGLPADQVIPFPWPELDDYFQPMQRGQLVLVAARPSVGKSSLARQIALHSARQGMHVVFFSLEVGAAKIPAQMAAMLSGIGCTELGRAQVRDQAAYRKSLESLRGLPIRIFERDRSIPQILGRLRAVHAQRPVDLVILDHGGCVSDVAMADQRKKIGVIGQLTKSLKAFAHDQRAVSLLLWQLKRQADHEENREPRDTDLRDSGELEQDADKILLIHRPDTNLLTRLPQSSTDSPRDLPTFFQNVIQAKGRDDGTGRVSFHFRRRTATFTPIRRVPD